ncbi:MAG: acyltransferase family protein [Deltaproteobacteria bacterium]|nr:acyltransferase family protein [Deltaproteobacteria bacterium]
MTPGTPPSPDQADPGASRDAYLDNARLLVMTLVVIGHALEPMGARPPFRDIFIFIYSFHIPVFVFLSGHLSRDTLSRPDALRLIARLLWPYVFFEIGLEYIDDLLVDMDAFTLSIFRPFWIMWYLPALLVWRLALPWLVRVPFILPVSVAAALAIGFARQVGPEFTASRIVTLLPFFLLGHGTSREQLARLTERPWRAAAVVVMIAGAFVAFHLPQFFPVEWFYGSRPYVRMMPHPDWTAPVTRMAVMLAAVAMGAAFFALVPGRRLFFTEWGERTLAIYLLHGVVAKLIQATDFYAFAIPDFWRMAIMVTVSLLVVYGASRRWVSAVFRPVLEPPNRWFHRRARKAG